MVPQVHMAPPGQARLAMDSLEQARLVMGPLAQARQVTGLLERITPLVLTLQIWPIKPIPASIAIWVC